MFDCKFILNLSFMKKVLLFQSSCFFFVFFGVFFSVVDILPSANFTESYIQNGCFWFLYFFTWVITKGATKFHFTHYLRVVIILFRTGLYKSALSTSSFGKTRFLSFCFFVFCVSVFCFLVFLSIFCTWKKLNNICIIREYDQSRSF